RWTHPKLGVISPADFIAVAEECGAIIGLGEYIIDEVCRQLKVWLLAGIPMVPVAINVSSLQLRSPQLYDFIVAALARHGVEPHYLEIEITETGLIDTESFIDTLRRLEALGIHLAIDDFGTGYSGLSHLRALPVSYLKIDRSFVKDIRNESNDATIVSNTISLAHSLNLETIAEGVETQEQIAHLKTARCDQAQGYFFSPPCDATAVETLLRLKFISIGIEE
ncbi:MAG: EAL domain-containing protein, partial [Deltaproteobacteria bacterium]|nr:EAL domain-containing protein [Deltaproteobacteria bacterium]